MTQRSAHALMIGLPSSGKTSFLAAFYHVVESGKLPSALRLIKYPAVREYLEKIRADWLSLVPQTRTQSEVTDQNVIELSSSPEGETLGLFFPDVAGESFRVLVEDRSYTREFGQLISSADRLLLFLHPDRVVESATIEERNMLAAEVDGGEPEPPVPADATLEPWDVSTVSTQVRLVDLLQTIRDLAPELKRIALIVSAWDRVEALANDPEQWIKARLPLLWQFLYSNRSDFQYRMFGVSALGGDLQADRAKLEETVSPIDRIKVIGGDDGFDRGDITLPVRWLVS